MVEFFQIIAGGFFKVQGAMVFHGDDKNKNGLLAGVVQQFDNFGSHSAVAGVLPIHLRGVKGLNVDKMVEAQARINQVALVKADRVGVDADCLVA